MPTISYTEGMRQLVDDDARVAEEILEDAINELLHGDADAGRILLKTYVSATIGFAELGQRMGKDSKNLMRALSVRGNPAASTLFGIIQACVAAQNLSILAQVTPKKLEPAQ